MSEVAAGSDKLTLSVNTPDARQPMTVADVQEGLKSAGFFPGGKPDGICGYRTLSAMRLFQEYVRTHEGVAMIPDGRFGPVSQQHLERWLAGRITSEWAQTSERPQAPSSKRTEYSEWLSLLESVKQRCTANPSLMLQKVNAHNGATDTRKVAQWDYASDGNIHLIGIRRNQKSGKFDDIFVLLIKGLVFKFQGTTEPGASTNPAGAPFLVQGQHDYHFGWHWGQYLALRPLHLDKGVLVVRSKGDMRLDDADLNKPLEANATINVHWGGKGMKFDVKNWSEGCQVVNGTLYINDKNELIDCSGFSATNNAEVAANSSRTRGAYNVLADVVTALSGDLPGNAVKYTLLNETEMELSPALAGQLADTMARVQKLLG